VSVGKPRVAYRQTLAKAVDYETATSSKRAVAVKYAVIHVRYTPLDQEGIDKWKARMVEEGEDLDPNNIYFDDEIVGGAVRRSTSSGRGRHPRDRQEGGQVRLPGVDVEAVLHDGKIHPVDSSADAFKLAGRESFREVQLVAGIKLLEPIMNVVVVAPDEYSGAICGDISRRRGMIEETSSDRAGVTSAPRCRWPTSSATPATFAGRLQVRRPSRWNSRIPGSARGTRRPAKVEKK